MANLKYNFDDAGSKGTKYTIEILSMGNEVDSRSP